MRRVMVVVGWLVLFGVLGEWCRSYWVANGVTWDGACGPAGWRTQWAGSVRAGEAYFGRMAYGPDLWEADVWGLGDDRLFVMHRPPVGGWEWFNKWCPGGESEAQSWAEFPGESLWNRWGFYEGQVLARTDTGLSFASSALTGWKVAFPMWLVAGLAAVWPVMSVVGWVRRRGREGRGLCGRCGYDLRASSGRCPECGEGIGGGV